MAHLLPLFSFYRVQKTSRPCWCCLLWSTCLITTIFLLQSPEDEQTLLVLFAMVHLFDYHYFLLQSPEDEQTLLVLFAVVHLFAMSSACANPVLYGFLNENFKQVLVFLGLTF
jgi:hypothetical protein